MSRISKKVIFIPLGTKFDIINNFIIVSGKLGILKVNLCKYVKIKNVDNKLYFLPFKKYSNALSFVGTMRSLVNNMIIGVNSGFVKKIFLFGVGYKVIIKFNKLILFLGFSHSINYILPSFIIAECFNQNEIVIKGCNKQLVGQVAADLINLRKPDPYKGKGVRYFNQIINLKEIKKK